MTEERADGRVLEMIGAAVMAGAYSSLAADLPEARPGLMKMSRKHSERVKALAGEICAAAGIGSRAAARR